MQNFKKPLTSLFYKSPRPNDKRLGEIVTSFEASALSEAKSGFVLVGHPDDEGIRLNHGRSGSREAPTAIRKAFYRLYPGQDGFPRLYDIGDFQGTGSLPERQKKALRNVEQIFKLKHRLIALGGGHDHAYSDIGGFLEIFKKERPIVINLDAHLDVRPLVSGPNSGTAFYQLLEQYPNVELIELGIQKSANSLVNLKYAVQKKVRIFSFEQACGDILGIFKKISWAKRPVFLSIDMDVFSSAFAPGVSAASPIGLDPHALFLGLPWLTTHANIQGFGIYEVSPPLDPDNRTAKLAAQLLHVFLMNSKKG